MGGRRDNGRTVGQREDSRMMGGRRDNGRMAGQWEDGRTTGDSRRQTTAPQQRWVQHWGLGDVEREGMVLLVECTRHCVKEEEGSGEKASIYMILAPTLAPHATPTRYTPVDHHYTIPHHDRAPARLIHIIVPRSLRGAPVCMGTAGGTRPLPATH